MTQTGGTQGRIVGGRYRLGAMLGRGGMGTVWRAVDEMLHRDVAVKELRLPDHLDDEERDIARERTLREARTAARVGHENVVTIHDVVEDGGIPWIVMELVEAQSLAEILETQGTFSPAEAAELGLKVLGALVAADEKGVLHRDVKPANILVTPAGRVVLTDFGIATVTGSATLTATGMLVGSPDFISPERAEGRRPALSADLWSLALVLYMAVEGRNPFRRATMISTLNAILTDSVDPPRRAGGLAPVIEGWLVKDPEYRMSAKEGERLLREVARSTPPNEYPTASAQGAYGTAAGTGQSAYGTGQGAYPGTGHPPGSSASQSVPPPPETPVGPYPYGAGTAENAAPAYGTGGHPGLNAQGTSQASQASRVSQVSHAVNAPDGLRPEGATSRWPVDARGSATPAVPTPPADGGPPARRTGNPRPAGGRRRRTGVVIAVVALVIAVIGAAVTAAVLMSKGDGDDPAKTADGGEVLPSAGSSEGLPAQDPSGAPSPGTDTVIPANPPPPNAGGTTGTAGPVKISGYEWKRDPKGFSLYVPKNSVREVSGLKNDQIDYRSPDNKVLIRVGLTTVGKDPLVNFQELDTAFRNTREAYETKQLDAYDDYRPGWNAAVWEFTWNGDPFEASPDALTPSHAIDLGIVTDKGTDYALYVASYEKDWPQAKVAFENAAKYFTQN